MIDFTAPIEQQMRDVRAALEPYLFDGSQQRDDVLNVAMKLDDELDGEMNNGRT